ncbi:hypothetical protein F2Q65_03055 [Thiohalocapsa marina]|uniref:Uncharacterized protein n=1 Tax=Thiohalocapsa marina TaxID=424902 RepID=A0A5M8FPR3_9GAMM|nr:hypothetical protein [Thiohalocapsa marina]KAA6186888.1 hypothetical protein F2Q65_03055 [Thiohalocapsa marina]
MLKIVEVSPLTDMQLNALSAALIFFAYRAAHHCQHQSESSTPRDPIEIFVTEFPRCHGRRQILAAIGEPRPPLISPARALPAWDEALDPASDWYLVAPPEPEFQFDQRIAW